MAIPSYAYLKLKILWPAGVITREPKTQWALDCEQDIIKLATTAVATIELRELSLWIPIAPPSLVIPMASSVFKTHKDAKVVQIDARDLAKTK
jgi:hypothetical protein